MKELFIPKRFTQQSQVLLARIDSILAEYASQGYDLTVRQLYYQLVAANIIPNSERSYKNIGSLVNDARLAGLIDWNLIMDRGREVIQNSHWDNPAEILETAARSFQIDKWETQENYVEVMVEKQALEGVLEPVCRELDVPFSANKGYSSASALYQASKRFLTRARQGKHLFVIYLGDHDPSGIDMTRDIRERLRLFIGTADLQREGDSDVLVAFGKFEVIRVALNMNQIEALNPPENFAKETDSRHKEYVRQFGESSWELDAIEPRQLASIVRENVLELRNEKLWEEVSKKEKRMRTELKNFAKESKFNKGR